MEDQSQQGSLEWQAAEFTHHKKSSAWYGALGGGSAVLAILSYALTGGDWMAPVSIVVAVVALAVFSGKEPSNQLYSVTNEGVSVGQTFMPYDNATSFMVINDGVKESIQIKQNKRVAPPITLNFPPEMGTQIVEVLSQFVPYVQTDPSLVDNVIDRFKL